MKKMFYKTIITAFTFLILGALIVVNAPKTNAQTAISSINQQNNTNVTSIMINDPAFANQRVLAQVRILNNSTGVTTFRTFNVVLNNEGQATLVVRGLRANTSYNFDVRVRSAMRGSRFGSFSSIQSFTTGERFVGTEEERRFEGERSGENRSERSR